MLAVAQITIRDEREMTISASAPSAPVMDELWLDTSQTPNALKRWTGSAWVSCGTDVDLSQYYTKTEMNTRLAQTDEAIALKADASTVSSLGTRITTAEQKITPQGIHSLVSSSAAYAYQKYVGRNYCLNSGTVYSFENNRYRNNTGVLTTANYCNLASSPDLFAHSDSATKLRISFEIRRTNVDVSAASTANVYSGIWFYYKYQNGSNVTTAGRGWYLRTTDTNFVATDNGWVRYNYGPLNLASYNPIDIAYISLGTTAANGMMGTVEFRNIKVEVLDAWTAWSAAPEDIYGLSDKVAIAETRISQNANNISLKVNTSTYNADKVYRSDTVPTTLYTNMLWLDTSQTPNLLKRYTGTTWVVAGAEEVKSSGIHIGTNDVAITTENFLLQLLDPNNNENVLMEMSANGNVGFKELYADNIVSDSVAKAYSGPDALFVNVSYAGSSDTYFRSLGEAVQAVNNRVLQNDVYIYLPYNYGDIYEPQGTHIRGIMGSGRLVIYGYNNTTLNSYITVKGCSAHISFQYMQLRESRPLDGSSRNGYLVELHMNHFVEFQNCTLDANGTTYDSVYCKSSHVWLNATSLYNAVQGLEVYMGTGVVKNCRGSCSWAMIAYAGIIFTNGTVPGGSRGSGENGQVYASGVTADYGNAAPPIVPDTYGNFDATLTKSWRGSWRSDTLDVVQGVYSDTGYKSSLNWNRGCMWFSGISQLYGATIKAATLTLPRKDGSGAGAAKTVYLCAITNTSASGTPSIAVNYGALGTIGRNRTVSFSIPAAAVQGLANGSYGGLCLYETPYNFGSSTYSNCYMRMSGTNESASPYLTVVYNNGSVG